MPCAVGSEDASEVADQENYLFEKNFDSKINVAGR